MANGTRLKIILVDSGFLVIFLGEQCMLRSYSHCNQFVLYNILLFGRLVYILSLPHAAGLFYWKQMFTRRARLQPMFGIVYALSGIQSFSYIT